VNLRLLSYNIHKGFSPWNRKFVLHSIKDSVRLTHADVVFLQEVQGQHNKKSIEIKDWPEQSQFEYLADSIWPHYAYGKNALYIDGHHGNAILSRFPILKWENIDISTNRLEQRGLLHATLELPDGCPPLHAICLHLDLLEKGRRQQVEDIISRIEEHIPEHEPLILAGDFNDWSGGVASEIERRLHVHDVFWAQNGRYAKSFPSWWPVLALDRIYCRGLEIIGGQTLHGMPWRGLSDHCALLAEVSIIK